MTCLILLIKRRFGKSAQEELVSVDDYLRNAYFFMGHLDCVLLLFRKVEGVKNFNYYFIATIFLTSLS